MLIYKADSGSTATLTLMDGAGRWRGSMARVDGAADSARLLLIADDPKLGPMRSVADTAGTVDTYIHYLRARKSGLLRRMTSGLD